MSTLTRLEALTVCETDYAREGMALLQRLPRLQSAAFSSGFALPGCLSRLTGLRRLCLSHLTVYTSDVDALLHLSQLTLLVLMGVTDEDEALAAGLQHMTQLRALAWLVYGPHRPGQCGQPVLPVPRGPFLGGLQHLEADAWQLEGVLPCATSLEQLSLGAEFVRGAPREPELTGAVRCAAALPLLRKINVYADWARHPASVLEALAGSRARLQWIADDLLNNSPLERLFYYEDD